MKPKTLMEIRFTYSKIIAIDLFLFGIAMISLLGPIFIVSGLIQLGGFFLVLKQNNYCKVLIILAIPLQFFIGIPMAWGMISGWWINFSDLNEVFFTLIRGAYQSIFLISPIILIYSLVVGWDRLIKKR